MQIRYKLLKVNGVYEKLLKEVTSDLEHCKIKVIEKLLQELKSVPKSPPDFKTDQSNYKYLLFLNVN